MLSVFLSISLGSPKTLVWMRLYGELLAPIKHVSMHACERSRVEWGCNTKSTCCCTETFAVECLLSADAG